jgi:hypothetical protein
MTKKLHEILKGKLELTKQPPAKAGGFKLSAESTDTGLKPVL